MTEQTTVFTWLAEQTEQDMLTEHRKVRGSVSLRDFAREWRDRAKRDALRLRGLPDEEIDRREIGAPLQEEEGTLWALMI